MTEDTWNKSIHTEEYVTNEEIKKSSKLIKTYVIQTPDSDYILNRFSSLTKLIRVISYVRRFKTKLKGNLSTLELKQSMENIIKLVQQNYYETESKILKEGTSKQLPNKLLQLHPFLDNNGIMRVGG